MKETVVLYPSVGVGHLAPMVELAKLLLRHGFSVTILIVESPFGDRSTAARLTSAHPPISFHPLPPISLPHTPTASPVTLLFELLRLANPHVNDFLRSLTETTTVRALVLDFFCTLALDDATELLIPSYFFFSTSATNLAAFVHIPTLHFTTANFRDLGDAPLQFPGLRPIPASDMPVELLDQNEEGYRELLFHFDRLPRADGIIANTFRSLEERALEAISDGLCVPGRPMPPVYCIGPLIAEPGGGEERHECLTWLDSQPRRSVVFLSFGSKGSFSAEQLKEVATGLERSGQRFLWVVRAPGGENPGEWLQSPPEPDLEALLPEGFLGRTEDRGLVVKSWAPQVAVLGHGSVGGFVTHCGWNSVLEAVCAGVPMIGWPLYAEQRMNKVFLVEEKRLAAEMKGYDKALVGAEEVESRVRWLMQSEGGRELRQRAAAAKESAMAAIREGGSSQAAMMELVAKLKRGGE